MPDVQLDVELVEDIAARLDLRAPNIEALKSVAYSLSRHYDTQGNEPPFEGVVDAATGVGKTYILAAATEYFAGIGQRNFAIVTPGRTILEKTVRNFSPNERKSLTASLSFQPVVITSENFATPVMRAAMDDEQAVKIFIFTVQALIRPTSRVARKTRKFQEGLGEALYDHLKQLDDLTVFADEHHVYYGKAFSDAVRGLEPRALIGLTATPHRRTREEEIIYRYPLAAAIADRYVKAPVIVGRRDDRTDPETKLTDGVRLLELKATAVENLAKHRPDLPEVHPVMLVVAQTIDDAEDYGRILRSTDFMSGRYADSVLVVHSDAPDDALAALEEVEDPASPVRVIISVGMLKEGWDVANVYVIASMRASISEILTEQTLGRGLRLPFGEYTEIEFLDTLEVLAHERYEDLLRRTGVLNEEFVDYRTRMVEQATMDGQRVAVLETSRETIAPRLPEEDEDDALELSPLSVGSLEGRTAEADAAVKNIELELHARSDMPEILIPQLRMSNVASPFSLTDIHDLEPFRQLGRRLRADPNQELRRQRIGARIERGADGLPHTVLVSSEAADTVTSQARLLPLDALIEELTDTLLSAPAVPARRSERAASKPIIEAFLGGLGDGAQEMLSAYLDRAAERLIRLVSAEQREYLPKPTFDEFVTLVKFHPVRTGRQKRSHDLTGRLGRGVGYEGWKRSLYDQVWFDSNPERELARMLDVEDDVVCWVRLHRNDLPILWSGFGRWYNPDFIVVEADLTHWVAEVKGDDRIDSDEVRKKREAAIRWANNATASDDVAVTWRYLLVSESDVAAARGSWAALKGLGA